ncbi:MAG: hypothetical protein A2287_09155 [Candidatus Melainabacteria bacterium RIFOXYA12_FULL_32_12]|nr:MAG: hypothetical protein A2287_09155 [Candidatus Melainabacteria bacterium RIFOXYA12_FULL_32_12]
MIKTLYAGIDVSKDKLDIAITQDGNKIISTATFTNKIFGYQKLFSWVKTHSNSLRACLTKNIKIRL